MEFLILFLLVLGPFLYFAPALFGAGRRGAVGIFLLNLMTGWTVAGWFAALLWATYAAPRRFMPRHRSEPESDEPVSVRRGTKPRARRFREEPSSAPRSRTPRIVVRVKPKVPFDLDQMLRTTSIRGKPLRDPAVRRSR